MQSDRGQAPGNAGTVSKMEIAAVTTPAKTGGHHEKGLL